MSDDPKSAETPPVGPLQKSNNEYPNAVVGMINGISARVSMALSQRDFPRAMSQAIGMPATRSSAATVRAIMKLF